MKIFNLNADEWDRTEEREGWRFKVKAFEAHVDAVRTSIPPNRLLVYEVKDGWEPLCSFLAMPVPSTPFPNTNNTEEFWELVRRGIG